jgi:hypothetical protein
VCLCLVRKKKSRPCAPALIFAATALICGTNCNRILQSPSICVVHLPPAARQPRPHPLTPAHPASLTTPEAARCEIALRTNRRSTATASTLASRRPKVPAMPDRKSYTCTDVVDAHISRSHPPSTGSFTAGPLVGRIEMAEEREAVAATPSRTWRIEHGQRHPRADGWVVQHEAKGVAGAGGGVPVDGGKAEERSPRLREHGRRCALARWEDRARATTPTSLRSGHATRGKSSSRRRRRRTWGSGQSRRAKSAPTRARGAWRRMCLPPGVASARRDCVSRPGLASGESLLRLPPEVSLG